MRKVLLVLAAAPLVVAPLSVVAPASAHGAWPNGGPACPRPTVRTEYDADLLTVHGSLPASGCAAREHRLFELATNVTRTDDHGRGDTLPSGTSCGPYRSAGDVEPGEPAPQDSCDVGMGVGHPEVEAAQYDIDLTYPGADGERTMTHTLFCRSDGEQMSCEDIGSSPERDAQR